MVRNIRKKIINQVYKDQAEIWTGFPPILAQKDGGFSNKYEHEFENLISFQSSSSLTNQIDFVKQSWMSIRQKKRRHLWQIKKYVSRTSYSRRW